MGATERMLLTWPDIGVWWDRTDLAGRVKLGMADLIDVADFLRRYKVQVQSRCEAWIDGCVDGRFRV